MFSRQRLALPLLLSCLVLLCGNRGRAADVTVRRDKYGVPTITAKTATDALYGLGYAMAQDNAERMALNFKQARGRMAEVEGKSQLLADGFLRSLGIEEAAEKHAPRLTGETKKGMERFIAGANRAIAEQKGKLPGWIQPFTAVDILALAQLLNAAFPLQDLQGLLVPGQGSNQFAIAPKRSATGHAILSIDPHLLWSGPLLWYEFALQVPGLHFRGITLSGLPYGVMGHTDRIAWCMTNNDPDLFDIYTVEKNPANPNQYNYHGQWRDFEKVSQTLQYIENGERKSRTQTVVRTAWGPLLPFRSQAVRFSMLGDWTVLEQAPKMAFARNAKAFRDVLKQRGLSMWNIVYADTQGTIGYQYNARVPKRDTSFDWTKPVSGSDPRTKWGDLWTVDELPHTENPASGLLVNANSTPWLTPLGPEIKATGWPAYVTTYGKTSRFNRLASLLADDRSITLEEAKKYATDTEVPYAKKAVSALVQAIQAAALPDDADLTDAGKVLTAWDGRADVESKGTALYYHWLRADRRNPERAQLANQRTKWEPGEAVLAVDSLRKAAQEVRKQFGKVDIAWGEMHRFTRGGRTAGVSGFQYGEAVAVVPNAGRFQNGKMDCYFGSSFRMIVHLDPKGVQSWSVLPFGNAQNPDSPHYADQMDLYRQGKYKDTFFRTTPTQKQGVSRQVLHIK